MATTGDLLRTNGTRFTVDGVLTGMNASTAYSGFVRLTITHGHGRPESTVSVTAEVANSYRIGQAITVELA